MEDTIYKILDSEVKKVGERQYEFIASTMDMDRDKEVIDVNGWDLKNFKKNPVIMFGHDYHSLPIGRATKIGVKDGKLMNVVEFPPEGTYEFADIVQRLVETGYLKTQSVGFIPKEWEDGDFEEKSDKPRRTFKKQELLEISIVPVPSNPNALRNAVDAGIITAKQFDTLSKKESIVEKHEKVTQEYIKDEIDYLNLLISENGMNEDVKKTFSDLANKNISSITFEFKETTPTYSNVIEIEPKDGCRVYAKIEDVKQDTTEPVNIDPTEEEILNEFNNTKFGGK
jgi:HK97 family phage prohead protease